MKTNENHERCTVCCTAAAADVETTPAVDEIGATTEAPTQFILASDLVGLDITNDQGEEVGEVSELLVDQDGMIQQVIFDVGGFLDIGDQPVAVGWDQMQVEREEGTAEAEVAEAFTLDELTVRYTGTAADLENLPAFDMSILEEEGSVLGEDTNTEDEFDASPYAGLIQVSEFQDYNLLNTNDEDLGEAEDLIVDLSQGMISHALVDFGGFLGIGENTVAVPWDELQLNVTDEAETFVLDVTQEQLEQAPLFSFDDWSYPMESGWETEVDSFWESR